MAFRFSEKDLEDRELLGAKLMDLASIVYSRHYYASYRERDDLISVGVLKCLSLIYNGGWDRSKGPLFNYLYSGVRNEMHNYLYKINKDVCMDEFFDDAGEVSTTHDTYFEEDLLSIDYGVVESVLGSFSMYGDLGCSIYSELVHRGFRVRNNPSDGEDNSSNIISSYGKDFYHDLVNRLVGAVLWKSQASYH